MSADNILNKETKLLTHRFLVSIQVEAETPLAVGSGKGDPLADAPVFLDANGLPMIPGTSLCGVLRHSLKTVIDDSIVNDVFGWQGFKSEEGQGSRLIVSSANILDADGKTAIEGLKPDTDMSNDFLKNVKGKLILRDHCRINHRGAADAEGHGKFDSQAVPAGIRFAFEMELIGTEADKDSWEKILDAIQHPAFRIGGGTRKGYGKLKIISVRQRTFDLCKPDDRKDYLAKTSSLNSTIPGAKDIPKGSSALGERWKSYKLEITPADLWVFGSGKGDDEADMTPLREEIVVWNGSTPKFDCRAVIPASSVKGAISHRTAFHYNRLAGVFADKLPPNEKIEDFTGENNKAVAALFGVKKDSKKDKGQAGRVVFSDLFTQIADADIKILNHVSIDRFTGGALDSALFEEKVLAKKQKFILELLVDTDAFRDDDNIKKAFEAALQDVCSGALPLGGGVMRGHGVFRGPNPIQENLP